MASRPQPQEPPEYLQEKEAVAKHVRLTQKTTVGDPQTARDVSMDADAGASSSKRPAEIPPETLEDELREILSSEAEQDVEEHAEWVRMENGTDWMPPEAVEKGDLAELQGLLDDGRFELI